MNIRSLTLSLVMALISMSAPASVFRAQETVPAVPTTPPTQVAQPAIAPIAAQRVDNRITIGGVPTLLLWARGLTDPADLNLYVAAGLNVLYIVATPPTPDTPANSDSSTPQSIDSATIISAAESRNLPILAGITTQPSQVPVNPHSAAYQQAVIQYIQAVTPNLMNRPGLLGWVIEGLAPEQLIPSDVDFRAFLQRQYGTIAALNSAWGTTVRDFTAITQASPAQVDAGRTAGLGRTTVDLGMYRYWLYRDLITLWVSTIRQVDPNRLIIIGGQNSFRAIATVPNTAQGIVTTIFTPTASPIGGFQGIEAIDLARRANTFAAFAFTDLRTTGSANLTSWASQALVHGVAGFGFDEWATIRGNTALQESMRRIGQLARSGGFPRRPTATAAILYEPLSGTSAYGYLPQPNTAEPGALFAAFSRGTRFGLVDYLTEDMLTGFDLSRYATIFAPQVFSLPAASQQAVLAYVTSGGVFVADWGIGVAQTGTLNTVTPALSQLFGIGYIYSVVRTPMDINVFSPDPLFPSLLLSQMTSGRRLGGAFSGILGDVKLMGENTKRLMSIMSYGAWLPSVVLNPVDRGYAIFASAPLWENWQRGDRLFSAFHGDLLARRSALVAGSNDLFAPVDIALYDTGAVGVYRPAGVTAPTAVRVASISSTTNLLLPVGGLQVIGIPQPTLYFAAPGLSIAQPMPIRASDLRGETTVGVYRYDPAAIVLEVHGPQARMTSDNGRLTARRGRLFSVTLNITTAPNGYVISSGSRHTVTLRDITTGRAAEPTIITADAAGTLTVPIAGRDIEATITPLLTQPSSPQG